MFTTANDMVKMKIKRNHCIIDLLELENKIGKIEMCIKYRLVNHNIKYIEDLKKINVIEVSQLKEYKLSREHDINFLIDSLNDLNVNVTDLQTELTGLKLQCKELVLDIVALNNAIPVFGYITNYKTVSI